jgi:hypothetical protein
MQPGAFGICSFGHSVVFGDWWDCSALDLLKLLLIGITGAAIAVAIPLLGGAFLMWRDKKRQHQ